MGAVPHVPAKDGLCLLRHAVWEVGRAGVFSTGCHTLRWLADNGRSIRVDTEKIAGVSNIRQVFRGERDIVWNGDFECLGVVDTEENWIAERCKLEIVEVICGVYIGLVLGVFGDPEIVVEFDAELSGALDVFVVEVMELCVSFDDVVY